MNVLVTGGAGYVGSHAVRALLRAGHEVWVYDNLARGHRAAVPEGRLIVGDLLNGEQLSSALRDHQIQAVLHFAALAYVGESVHNPALYYRNNVTGSLTLLEAMRTCGVGKIVFSSTTASYGVPDELPIREDSPQRPINPYGRSKLMVEQMLADYATAYGLSYAALRYFNAAGASPEGDLGEHHTPETHLIPLVLEVAQGRREQISIFGNDYPTPDGTCVRDYVHVDDLAAAHVAALERLEPGSGLHLNLGTGRGHSVRQVIETCREITGRDIPTNVAPRRAGDPPELVADATAAKQVLNWAPQYPHLSDIVRTAWNWHRSHPGGYDSEPSEQRQRA